MTTFQGQYVSLTDGATVATDVTLGDYFYLSASRSSRTMSNPTNAATGQQLTYLIESVRGTTTTSWGTAFVLAGPWQDPQQDYARTVTFFYNGTSWIETTRTGANLKLKTVPSDIAGLVAWYDACTLDLADTDAVGTWTSRIGDSRKSLIQNTGASQPTFKVSIQNSLPVVRFDGTDDYVDVANPLLAATTLSVFAVFAKADTVSGLRTLIDINGSSGVTGALIWGSQDGGADRFTPQFGTGTVSDYNVATPVGTAFHQWSWIVPSGAQPKLYKDAGSAINPSFGSSAAVNVAAVTLHVGSHLGTLRYLYGDLAELIIYNVALNDTDRASVAAYQKAKWGTP